MRINLKKRNHNGDQKKWITAFKGPADWFTGRVRIDPLFEAPEPARVRGASVAYLLGTQERRKGIIGFPGFLISLEIAAAHRNEVVTLLSRESLDRFL
jgi:hypothetical protein